MREIRRLAAVLAMTIALISVPYTGVRASGKALTRFTLSELNAEIRARSADAAAEKSVSDLRPKGLSSSLASFTNRALITEINVREKAIYGFDDRLEVFDAPSTQPIRNLHSTAILVRPNRLERQANGTWKILARSFREEKGVCRDERFAEQPVPGFCTGFLISSDHMVTAGHCVTSVAEMESILVVFGFEMRDKNTVAAPIRDADVYRPVELLGRAQDPHGADWAVIRLDRAVAGREALTLSSSKIPDGEPVYVVGHPVGLPKKFGGKHAVVRDNKPAAYFVANLNTYGGNSGSPVFDFKRGEVVGILVRGETDFRRADEGCLLSLICPDADCRGEDVTRILQIPENLRALHVVTSSERPATLYGRRRSQ
jgi:hypothetical protein